MATCPCSELHSRPVPERQVRLTKILKDSLATRVDLICVDHRTGGQRS
jgi:hypothetical protein